jgi:hypothetical protein
MEGDNPVKRRKKRRKMPCSFAAFIADSLKLGIFYDVEFVSMKKVVISPPEKWQSGLMRQS